MQQAAVGFRAEEEARVEAHDVDRARLLVLGPEIGREVEPLGGDQRDRRRREDLEAAGPRDRLERARLGLVDGHHHHRLARAECARDAGAPPLEPKPAADCVQNRRHHRRDVTRAQPDRRRVSRMAGREVAGGGNTEFHM